VHRWLTITVAFLSIALVGAGAPFPSNTPSAVVFTLVPSGTASLEAAARIAAAISVRLGTGGSVTVKSAPGDVKQADFLSAAQKLGVDYYVSGFVATLGSGFSVALQLVSTSSGAAIWSGTATLNGTDDVGDAAEVIGRVMVGRASQLGYGPAPASGGGSGAAPAPARQGGPSGSAGAAATQAVAAAAAQPTAAPGPRAGVTIAVLDGIDANGGLIPQEITYATDAIASALQQEGVVTTRWHRKAPALDVAGALLCNDTKTGSVVEPSIYSIHTDPNDGTAVWNTVRVQLVRFDCATHQLRRIPGGDNSAFNWKIAADRSITDVVKRYFAPSDSSGK